MALVCKHPRQNRRQSSDGTWTCGACLRVIDPIAQKRGRNNSARGKRHSLDISRKYGMVHIENDSRSGRRGPIDSLGRRWKQQNKSKQAQVPVEWALAFSAMDGVLDGRLPRMVIRYLPGPGVRGQDFIIIRGDDWLLEFGPDSQPVEVGDNHEDTQGHGVISP